MIDTALLHEFINVPELGTTIIPCRPTSDDVKMTFKQRQGGGNKFEDITGRLEERHFRYEPKTGLIITNGSIQFHNEVVLCTASRGNDTVTLKALFILGQTNTQSSCYVIFLIE